jgi:hypothetical protein
MIIIGSTAIKYWLPQFPRQPKDLDVICKEGEDLKLLLSYDKIEKLENPILLDHYKGGSRYLPLDMLYTLKISHAIGWDINWEKHTWDLNFMKFNSPTELKVDMDLFNKLYQYWTELHGKNKRSDLEMSAEDFFDNALDTHVDHDYIHTILNPEPTYKKISVGEVEVSMEKFQALSTSEKTNLIQEEVMVMAAERYKGWGYKHKYSRMLKKFILNHAPIEVGIFALENIGFLSKAPFDFMTKINTELERQNIKPFN